MGLLLLKLILTPIFIGGVSLAGRRWGPSVSGLLMGLPLTSGPISLFLALQYGPAFAARSAVGNLAGQGSNCCFFLAYGLASRRMRWPGCVAVSLGAFLAATALGNQVTWTLAGAAAFVLAGILVVARLLPKGELSARPSATPWWDLPARMVVATAFVLALTGCARTLGPQLSGLLAPFPVYGVVLAAFTQRQDGPVAASRLLLGNVLGSFAFLAFFLVAANGLERGFLVWSYVLAAAGAVATSAALFWGLNARPRLVSALFG